MWLELEGTYNNNAVVKVEDELAAQKMNLLQLYQETKGQANVRKEQSKVLDERDQVNEKIRGKASDFNTQMREAKATLKTQ